MRYFLEFSYDGSSFHGWQRQPNAMSVQERIEDALSIMFQREIEVVGAGRTDAGVNARQMYAHFDIEEGITSTESFLKGLNRMVGKEIAVSRVSGVKDDAHARFDAIERTYKYFVIFEKSPFLRHSTWFSPSYLDIDAMNEAAALLISTSDFTSFAKLHSDVKTNICDVRKAVWQNFENVYDVHGIVFTISADRFLRNMVRAVVGSLVDVGRRKLDLGGFKEIIEAKDRSAAGTSMPPQALFLWEVKYPSDIFLSN